MPRPIEPVPTTLTCGELEENLSNNRDMANTLHDQGYRVGFVELPDVHNYVAWREAFPKMFEWATAQV